MLFPCYPLPLFQNESTCETIQMKMSFICIKMGLYGFARRLVLRQRHRVTRKWPFVLDSILISIEFVVCTASFFLDGKKRRILLYSTERTNTVLIRKDVYKACTSRPGERKTLQIKRWKGVALRKNKIDQSDLVFYLREMGTALCQQVVAGHKQL